MSLFYKNEGATLENDFKYVCVSVCKFYCENPYFIKISDKLNPNEIDCVI